jgi:hypothetical protein
MDFQPFHREAVGTASSRARGAGGRRRGRVATLRTERLEERELLSTILWKGGNGEWSFGSNWVGGKVPGFADTAVIQDSNVTITHSTAASDSVNVIQFQGTGSTLSISDGRMQTGSITLNSGTYRQSSGTVIAQSVTAQSLTLAGGILDLSGAVVSGPMTWSGGMITGGGTFSANGGLTLGGSDPNTSYTMTLGTDITFVNKGTAVMKQVTGGNYSTQLILSALPFDVPPGSSPSVFDNKGSFDFQGDNSLINPDQFGQFGDTAGIFMNEGRLTKTDGSDALLPSVIGATFNNVIDGTIELSTGALWLQGGGTISSQPMFQGTLSVNAGTTLEFRGGTFQVTGHLDNSPGITPGNSGAINFSGATVNFTGKNALYSQFGDTQISGGTFHYESSNTAEMASLTISGADTKVFFGAGSTLDLNQFVGGTLTQTGGELDLEGGTLIAPVGYNLQAGTFSGSGTIKGAVTNGGQLFPGGQGTTGLLTISDSSFTLGTYTQTPTGSIDFDIGGTASGTQYDQVVATSHANSILNGDLKFNLIDGFSPAVGDSFTFMTGAFDYRNITMFEPDLGVGKGWQPFFRNFDLTFQVVAVGGFGVSLAPSDASPSYGKPESFTALVAPTLGGPLATGTVNFFIDGTPLGGTVTLTPGALRNATATSISTASIGAGPHTIRVDYSGDSSYPATSTSISLTVSKAHLGVVADNKTRSAGQSNPALSASFVGFLNGDDATSAKVTGTPTLSTSATAASPAGVYSISVVDSGTLSAPNYDFPASGFVNGTLTITPATSASVVASSTLPNSTYGRSIRFTAAVSGGGPVPTGTVQFVVDGANFGGPVTLVNGAATSTATTALGASSHSIVARYSGDTSYGGNSGTFTQQVAKASLTVIADDKSATRFSGLPPLSYSFSGFVNSENAKTAGVVVVASLSAPIDVNSPAGFYPIHPIVNSFTSANYKLAGVRDGTLTLKPAVMNVMVEFGNNQKLPLSAAIGRDLPFLNIQAIDMVFSDDVNLAGAALQLVGVKVPKYQLSGPTYDATTRTAKWTLSSALGADRLTLDLAGVVAPPKAGTGPNITASPYITNFAVLPGDVNGDGVVTIADAIGVRNHLESVGGSYLVWADIDGSFVVDITDMNEVRKRIGQVLP